jgi:hypothetical protein
MMISIDSMSNSNSSNKWNSNANNNKCNKYKTPTPCHHLAAHKASTDWVKKPETVSTNNQDTSKTPSKEIFFHQQVER